MHVVNLKICKFMCSNIQCTLHVSVCWFERDCEHKIRPDVMFIAIILSYRLLILKHVLFCNILSMLLGIGVDIGAFERVCEHKIRPDIMLFHCKNADSIMMSCNVFCRWISLKTVRSLKIWTEENLDAWEELENLPPHSRAHYWTSGESLHSWNTAKISFKWHTRFFILNCFQLYAPVY